MRNAGMAFLTAVTLVAAGSGCGNSNKGIVCPAPTTSCGATCRLLTSDPTNCGKCGTACAAGQACIAGACATNNCTGTQMPCNGGCADFTMDSANCGACGTACTMGQSCQSGVCKAGCSGSQKMCNNACVDTTTDAMNCGGCGMACTGAQTCSNGACGGGGANTGDPCVKAADCGGMKPQCLTKDSQGNTWPGGYCISQCNPQKNDPNDTTNPACIGGGATCLGQGTSGACETICSGKTGATPCTRTGYSCFQTCEPTSISKCDPTKAGICGPKMTCVRLGADNVGQCAPSCDPFAQGCMDIMGQPAGCYASDDTGEGVCSQVFGMGADGDACMYLNACNPGLGCYAAPKAMMAQCRPYCGGAKSVACANGKMCVDLSTTVKKTATGICGG